MKSFESYIKIVPHGKMLYIYKVLCFIILLFTLDFVIGTMLEYFFFKQESGFEYRTTYSIEKTKADILIFGASRANHHYYPDAFEERLGLSCYNVGRDGTSIFYHYAVLKAILRRYNPKMIILDFGSDYDYKQESYDRISLLLPYYKAHPELHEIVELKGSLEKFKLISKIYPYNSSVFSIIAGNSNFNKERFDDIKGYLPLNRTWQSPLQIEHKQINYMLDTLKMKYYEKFINECIAKKIKLYIVCSPYFVKYNFKHPDIQMGEKIAKKYNIDFYNYYQDSVFLNNHSFFEDPGHINNKGAIIFTNMVIEEIIKHQKMVNLESTN